jgi:hypothetical protein
LELAQWLTSEHNPLTSRVYVNRAWKHLFGSGLVATVDNFGVMGDLPSHPELLDYLAQRFVRYGWSTKKLVRSLVLNKSYQLDSARRADAMAIDPTNRLLWRHSPRRLDAEEIRDAVLAAAGTLKHSRPRNALVKNLFVIELRTNSPEARALRQKALTSKHRSVYLPLLRGLTPLALDVFDFADPDLVTGRRDVTTVATQALFMLNDSVMRQHSEALARRLLEQVDMDDADRVKHAYQLVLGRSAKTHELERAARYLSDY